MPRGVYDRGTTAKKQPARNPRQRPVEPMEVDTVQPADVDLPSSGALGAVAEPRVIERTTDVLNTDKKAESLAFMEEKLEVIIHESTDENAEKVCSFGVNGRMIYLERGVTYKLARKYVARLARMKSHSVSTVEARDYDGGRITRIKRASALAYPFSVNNDPNPRGAAWLRNILQQP